MQRSITHVTVVLPVSQALGSHDMSKYGSMQVAGLKEVQYENLGGVAFLAHCVHRTGKPCDMKLALFFGTWVEPCREDMPERLQKPVV